jgi:hypothetical protein
MITSVGTFGVACWAWLQWRLMVGVCQLEVEALLFFSFQWTLVIITFV